MRATFGAAVLQAARRVRAGIGRSDNAAQAVGPAHYRGRMSAPVISAAALTKAFGNFVAVRGVDLEVETGECFGMLGPNGAGKTSTMRMIGCATPVSSGSLTVLGTDVTARGAGRRVKARLGVVPQEDSLDEELTVEENLVVYARYFGIRAAVARERAGEQLAFMSLADRAHDKVRTLSGGMKRRLVIARSLVNDPDLVLLDEPTTGLDPQARHHIWDRLRTLKASGATLVLTTHYMEEATQLCDRLVIMDGGRVLVEGSPRDLVRRCVRRHVVEVPRTVLDGRVMPALDESELIDLHDRVLVHTDDGREVVSALADAGIDADDVYARPASLEDVFLALTGRDLLDAGPAAHAGEVDDAVGVDGRL